MPLGPMPKPVSVVEVKKPIFAVLAPASPTFRVSLPLPTMVMAPWMKLTTPLSAGALLPMLIVLEPELVFTLVVAPVA